MATGTIHFQTGLIKGKIGPIKDSTEAFLKWFERNPNWWILNTNIIFELLFPDKQSGIARIELWSF